MLEKEGIIMKKVIKILFIGVGLLFVANTVFAGIGENFEKGGSAFWGGQQ